RAEGPPVNRGLTNRVARSRYPKWVGDPDAHEQQVSHERQPALLHVLRRAVPSPRRLRGSLAHLRRAALLLGVLCRRRRGSAVSAAPRLATRGRRAALAQISFGIDAPLPLIPA